MKAMRILALALGLTLSFAFTDSGTKSAEAGYGGWHHNSSYGYHYNQYHYTPTRYHYCIYYPRYPRYRYFYNPYQRSYWGRFDTEGKEGANYSLLKEADRKEKLKDIPESAFPEPGALPPIPGTDVTLEAPPEAPDSEG